MKALILVFLMANATGMHLASQDLGAITRAISTGDAATLGQYFDQTVEVAVIDIEDAYSKDKAVEVVGNFFAKNAPRSFSQVHQGSSRGNNASYCIGNLSTATGTYRVYIYMKIDDGKSLVQELRFDEE